MFNFIQNLWQKFKSKNKTNLHDEFDYKIKLHLQKEKITLDSTQQKAIPHLHQLYMRVQQKNHHSKCCGLYLWGGVGTGKTLLMDILYQVVDIPKVRLHHHELFKNLMNDLHLYKDTNYPLEASIQAFTKQYRLACFDDLHLNDIADGKLWQGVFEQAQKNGLIMLITSNTQPQDLMDTPGYREKIQPLLDSMQKHLEIINVDAGIDYRTMQCHKKIKQHSALLSENQLESLYYNLTQTLPSFNTNTSLTIQNRSLNCLTYQNKTILFTLQQLCGTTRSYADYIELSERFDCIIIRDFHVKIIVNSMSLQRFIWLIDIIYDKNTRFFILSNKQPISIIQHQSHPDIQRTISRLKQLL